MASIPTATRLATMVGVAPPSMPKHPLRASTTRRGKTMHAFDVKASSEKAKKDNNISFGDRLLDYIEGGPKLRKWYGAPDQLPKDGGSGDMKEEQSEELDEVRDAVLVTDANSETGQLIVLSLILKRVRIRALVKDAKVTAMAFGSYVEPIVGDVNSKSSLRKAVKGVQAIICPSAIGELADPELLKGVEHIVFLSELAVYRNSGGLMAFLNAKARREAEEAEVAIMGLGIRCTIIRAGMLRDEPGGMKGYDFQEGCASKGTISREDVATICVKALESPPEKDLVFEVVNGEEEISDWDALFNSLNSGAPLTTGS